MYKLQNRVYLPFITVGMIVCRSVKMQIWVMITWRYWFVSVGVLIQFVIPGGDFRAWRTFPHILLVINHLIVGRSSFYKSVVHIYRLFYMH